MQQTDKRSQIYFCISLVLHVGVVALLILGLDVTSPMVVIENTNQHDVISAVVLGDTAKSKILRDEPAPLPPPPPVESKSEPPPPPKIVVKPAPDKNVIALEAARKKVADEKVLADKKLREMMAKNLMADILKQSKKQKKLKETDLKNQFQKTLKEQAEKSLRQQLLNEEIKLKGTETRQSQGVVDKYKALIIQAISENWIVPVQADKKLSSELLIRVAPGGMVLDVQISKSSGDPALDSSARAAVLKASPLPVPPDLDAFEPFRQFVLKVKPENIIDNGSLGA